MNPTPSQVPFMNNDPEFLNYYPMTIKNWWEIELLENSSTQERFMSGVHVLVTHFFILKSIQHLPNSFRLEHLQWVVPHLWIAWRILEFLKITSPPVLAAPHTIAVADNPDNAMPVGYSIGDCITDWFQITGGTDTFSSSIICGTNSGKHSKLV